MILELLRDHLADCLRTVVCTLSVIFPDMSMCQTNGVPLYGSAQARVAAAFALYMFVVGIVFVIPPSGRWLCKQIDFPEDFQQWAWLFAGAIFVVALFYATAARSSQDMESLHWVSVFGRLLVLIACLWLCIRGNGHGLTLLLLGLVDGTFALLSAYYLAKDPGVGGMVLVGGLWQLVIGVVFVMFPGTLAQLHTRRPAELLRPPLPVPRPAARSGSAPPAAATLAFAAGAVTETERAGMQVTQSVVMEAAVEVEPQAGFRGVKDILKSAQDRNLDEANRRWALIFAVVLAALGSYATIAGKMGFRPYYSPVMVGHFLAALICGSIAATNYKRYWPVLMFAAVELALGLGTLYFMLNASIPPMP